MNLYESVKSNLKESSKDDFSLNKDTAIKIIKELSKVDDFLWLRSVLEDYYGTDKYIDIAEDEMGRNSPAQSDEWYKIYVEDAAQEVIKALKEDFNISDEINESEESNDKDQVYVVCYNDLEIWESRKAAQDFYALGVQSCEGAEKERYVNVFMDLMNGEPIAYDGDDEDFIMEIEFRDNKGNIIKRQKVDGRKTVTQVLKDIKSGKALREDEEFKPNGVVDDIKKRGDGDLDVESPLELNTGVLPIVNVDCYSRQDAIYPEYNYNDEGVYGYEDDEGNWVATEEPTQEEVDESIMYYAPEVIEEYINGVLPGSKVEAVKMYHPRQYNFGGDELEFKVSFDPAKYNEVEDAVVRDGEFKEFLKKYSSHSGFFSYMADNLDDFYQQDGWKRFVQVIMFCLRNQEDEMKNSEETLWDVIYEHIGG